MTARSCLLVAVGVAAGIGAASLSPRPAAPPTPPQIEVRPGHAEDDKALRLLHPQSIRVGDQITQLAPPGQAGREKALVYLNVNGTPVLIVMAVGPAQGATPHQSAPPPSPSAVGDNTKPYPATDTSRT